MNSNAHRTTSSSNESDDEYESQVDIVCDPDLIITHLNTAKRRASMANIGAHYVNDKRNYLVSINEPPANNVNNAPILVNSFQQIVKHSTQQRISAMILAGGLDLQICKLTQFTNEFCAAAEVIYKKLFNFIFISFYFHPDHQLSTSLDLLQAILNSFAKPIYILTHSNSHNSGFGDSRTDARGEELFDFVLKNNLISANSSHILHPARWPDDRKPDRPLPL